MASRTLRGTHASKFTEKNLVLRYTDPVLWQSTFEDPANGDLWLQDYPESGSHGGGPVRLRSLPLDRVDIVELLLKNLHLDIDGRAELGTDYVRVSEIKQLISVELMQNGWYPPDARPWPVNGTVFEGYILQLTSSGTVTLWNQRDAAIPLGRVLEQSEIQFKTMDEAVIAFITKQWPQDQIDGIRILAG